MIKRCASLILALLLAFCLLPSSALAVGILPQPDVYVAPGSSAGAIIPGGSALPQPDVGGGTGFGGGSGSYQVSGSLSVPSISSHPFDVGSSVGGVPAALRVEAYTLTGQLGYQWYSLGSSPYGGRSAISGAVMASYTPPQIMGTNYYCVGVYTVNNGMRSSEVYSNVAAVNYSGVEIVSAPTRTTYAVGDNVSLQGLWVRIYDSNGSFWDSYNGDGLNVYPSSFDRKGSVAVEVSNGLSAASFYVTVGDGNDPTDPNHEHKFGDWEVTKEATCVTTGTRTRTCACGESETEDVLKTDHSWDDGTITKQPTNSSNGARLYTCTVCQANRSEIIPAGTQVEGDQAQGPANSLEAAQNGTLNTNTNTPGTNGYGSTYGGSTYSNMPEGALPPGGNTYANASADPSQAGTIGGDEGTTGTQVKSEESSGWWLIPVSALLLVGTGIGAYYLMRRKISDD